MRMVMMGMVVAVVSLSACSRGEERNVCTSNTAYLDASSGNPLRVPDDLSLPDESDALRVPDEEAVLNPAAPDVECLEYSPAFGVAESAEPEREIQ